VNFTTNKTKLIILLKTLWYHFSLRRQRQCILLLCLIFVSAFAEIISLGAVLPFLGILAAPDLVFNHSIVSDAIRDRGITSPEQLVLPLTIIFVSLALIAGMIRVLLLWVSSKLAFSIGTDLSIEIYRRTLYQPYSAHVASNSSDLLSIITSKIQTIIYGILLPLSNLINAAVLLVAVSIALVAINPLVALTVTVVFGASYGLISWVAFKGLQSNGQRIADEQTKVIKVLQEGLGGIRDILLDGAQQVYCNVYQKADYLLKKAQGNNIFISSSPRPVMETLAMILIAALAYGLSRQTGGINAAIPLLGAIALGAQRLLPALQQGYTSWATIVGTQASLADTLELLDQPIFQEALQPASTPLPFQKNIQFEEVRFQYTKNGPWVLNKINLTIVKGSRVGIIGATGGGKSTLMDLLMGLLMPVEGKLLVDGQIITGSQVKAWQRNIAHVPQSIYLTDASFAENIALCLAPKDINMDRLKQTARQAQIASFIESQPEGYNTLVGERGTRLSGGQRQRIGIARALYKQASMLVFDEATSALDNTTEKAVMSTIEDLSRDFTIVIIAHRLSTLQHCDTIVELESGRVKDKGTFEQLFEGKSFPKKN
jgi:ATP-binding cassette, subfamily B, bacterial PglK